MGKTDYSLYEPVLLDYTLTNPTSQTIESSVGFASNESLDLTIVPPGGRPFSAHTWDGEIPVRAVPTLHPPGESVTSTVDLLWNERTKSLTFGTPGTYRIEATLDGCSAGPIKAPPVEVTVDEPSASDRAAIAFLGSAQTLVAVLHQGVGLYCMNQRDKEQECVAHMREFVDQFAASAYAPAVTAQLATSLLRLAGRKGEAAHDRASIQAYRADVRVVLDLVDGFIQRSPDHPQAARMRWIRIEALEKIGTPDELRESLVKFMEMYPGRRAQFDWLRQKVGLALPARSAQP